MNINKTIKLTRDELDEAVEEYLAKRDITFNVDNIHYLTSIHDEVTGVWIDAR